MVERERGDGFLGHSNKSPSSLALLLLDDSDDDDDASGREGGLPVLRPPAFQVGNSGNCPSSVRSPLARPVSSSRLQVIFQTGPGQGQGEPLGHRVEESSGEMRVL